MIIGKNLWDFIDSCNHSFISLTGGGGKTTLMQELACSYRSSGKTVLMTTTTKIQSPDVYKWNCDYVFTCCEDVENFVPTCPCSVLFACESRIPGKLVAPEMDFLYKLRSRFDVVLCEADGSRHLPLKIHSERDPVIVDFNDFTVCVMGSRAFGRRAGDVTFGISSQENDVMVDCGFLDRYIHDPEGLLKGTEKDRRCIVLTASDECGAEYIDYFERIREKVILH